MRDGAGYICRVLACALCVFVTLNGIYAAWAMDLRANPLLSALYCAIPASSIFVFAFVRRRSLEIGLHAAVALGYLTVYSMLNWRTCAELGYCSSVQDTVLTTLSTRAVEAAIAIVVLRGVSIGLGSQRASARR
ncbi:MAG TPA: hypothetical protein VG893_11055 [Terracidiphilus sp.]|nr:hypothetical protein [Terracidiphilus sp.]